MSDESNDHIRGILRRHIEDFIILVQNQPVAAVPGRICGVEADVIERFLRLVRDKYHKVDEANYFLELNLGYSGLSVAVTNQRDVLSHLATIVTRSDMTHDDKVAQLGEAEEHLRRATVDAYAAAVDIINLEVLKLYDEYREIIPAMKERHATLSSAPDVVALDARFRAINELRLAGRDAKRENEWNEVWEAGVHSYITAFWSLREIERELEGYLARAHTIQNEAETKTLHWVGFILAFLFFGLGIICAHYLHW